MNLMEGNLMLNKIKNLVCEEEGQGMAEYGLLLALIAVVVIGVLQLLGPTIANVFNNVNNAL